MTAAQLSRYKAGHAPLNAFEPVWDKLKDTNTAINEDEALCIMSLTAQYHWSPPVILEIGTGHGTSAILMNMGGGHVLTVDQDVSKIDAARRLAKDMGAKNITFIHGKSPDAVGKLQDETRRKINMAFIDGDHSYDAVKADLREAIQVVPLGGWIMGHDYWRDETNGHPGFEVKRAVDEMAATTQISNPITFKERQDNNNLYLCSVRV